FGSTHADCSGQQKTLIKADVSGSGILSKTFIWPTALNSGTYYICAAGITSGAPSYQILAGASPTISLSAPTIQLGQQLTITGSNFVGLPSGAQIVLSEIDAGNAISNLPIASVSDNGTFQTPWTVNGSTGNVTIHAASAQDGSAEPALQASAALVVQVAATQTPTQEPSPSVTAAASPTPILGVTPQQNTSNSGVVIGLIVGIVVLLVVLLVAALLLLRGRQGGLDDPYGSGYSPGAYPG